MSLTVDHGKIGTKKFSSDSGRVSNDEEGVSDGVGLQCMHLIKMLLIMETGTSQNSSANVDGGGGKKLPEPCEREWRTGEKIDGIHGVPVKSLFSHLKVRMFLQV